MNAVKRFMFLDSLPQMFGESFLYQMRLLNSSTLTARSNKRAVSVFICNTLNSCIYCSIFALPRRSAISFFQLLAL